MRLVDPIGLVMQRKGGDVWSLPPTASVYEAIEMMSDKKVGALLVIVAGSLVGIISERDYARKVILKGRSSRETQVQEVMTSTVITMSPADTVEECMRTMTENRIRHLPVIENDRVVGVVSIGDLVNWVISAQEEEIRQLHSYIAGSYPG